ncbi:crAss001_48 related protein [Clostridium sp.]|uniref:crAss001_48 related protein n=1 Tax=Clostridium sp. TaxID=1506 RepID=UPI003F67F8E9
MQDWQKRVVEERRELSEKVSNLGNYIDSDSFKEIDIGHQKLLDEQWSAMVKYLVALDKRINLF